MIVCIDSGNSRIKWGVSDGQAWLAQGALEHSRVGELGDLVRCWPNPRSVVMANVAGDEAGRRIRAVLAGWKKILFEVHSSAHCCGVTNLYKNPGQLGVDRWCALIGARSLTPGAALVVMAGTATTIDTLTADGSFQGGLILPGCGLMRDALGRGTAKLPFASGKVVDWPTCTDDAIQTGILEAQAGAIERAWGRLEAGAKLCLIGGGYAESIVSRLALPLRVAQNLPLEGLKQIALASRAA